MIKNTFHPFHFSINKSILPRKFTFPFNYTPHPLCISAFETLQLYLQTKVDWAEELSLGKMFGVLVVQNKHEELGFLAAYSGNLAGRNDHSYFVPPVFDMLQKDGFFKTEEKEISCINEQIEEFIKNDDYIELGRRLKQESELATTTLLQQKQELKGKKKKRDHYKKNNPCCKEKEIERLNKESQYEKAEYKRLEKSWEGRIKVLQDGLNLYSHQIEELKSERKRRSATLQQKLFDGFLFLNILGEKKGLSSIFEQTVQKTPPAGAGECAAPKLLNHAFVMGYKPVAMAEFWWGTSPKKEIRQHGKYYPACKGKCEPILQHMLKGMSVEADPLKNAGFLNLPLEILFEDEHVVVVNKPSGLLSVSGKSSDDSVYSRIRANYPEASGPLVVHRLDMNTSGLLLIAKNKAGHKNLQAQFKNRSIKKRYIALLDGRIEKESGTIALPLSADYNNRPCQMVDLEHGKPALTHWRNLGCINNITRIEFSPVTGRTHQLRIHAAHFSGLNAPIIGDELYGNRGERLHLHAEYLKFKHPACNKTISIEKKADF
jgi:tRNA pseudouridine32 synthase/23S rRNA pseudouridine746 synthase